jgi:hypothetical protein
MGEAMSCGLGDVGQFVWDIALVWLAASAVFGVMMAGILWSSRDD